MKCDPDTQAYLQLLETRVNDVMAKTSGGAGGIFFQQGGNSFGATGVLGTKDAFGLSVLTNNAQFMAVSTAGATQLYSTNGIAISAANASGGAPPAVVGGTLTLTGGTGGFALSSAAASTISTSVGAISVTSAAALTLTGTAASTWSTSAGALTITAGASSTWSTASGSLNLTAATSMAIATTAGGLSITAGGGGNSATLDGAGPVNLGNTTATSVVIGNTANATGLTLASQALTVTVPAGQIATTANVIAGGGAIPATLNYLICTINGTARKIPFAAT